jgi:histidinol-phosphate/aromatic aminotransferase/cobyric acid decarboxylase-like protein
MLDVCRQPTSTALVCVDEAYIEFSARASLAARLARFPNLVLLRTLSKAYALAGARLGTLIASEDIVGLLKRIIPPYALPAPTVEDVLKLTEAPQRAMASARIQTILAERSRVRQRLEAAPTVVRVFPSDANFLLVECRDARKFLEAGKSVGLLVRDFSGAPGLANCLRVTIGTPEQNDRLLKVVELP